MKWTTLFLGAVFAAFLLINCNGASTKTNSNNTNTETNTETSTSISEVLSPSDFEKKLESTPDAQLVDVRTPGEFADGSLEGALNIDYNNSAVFQSEMEKLDKNKPLLVFCKKGGRSAGAANICKELGFKEIYDMEGGYTAWQAAK